jgi:Flp pilus assembly protein TadB
MWPHRRHRPKKSAPKQQERKQKNSLYRKIEKGIKMPLLQVVLVLVVVGVLLWLVNRFIPMASSIKSILNAVVVIAVVLWLLNIFGLLSSLSNIHVGKT